MLKTLLPPPKKNFIKAHHNMEHKTNYTGRYFRNSCVSSKQFIMTQSTEERHGQRRV